MLFGNTIGFYTIESYRGFGVVIDSRFLYVAWLL